jgi:hypothetical protein
MLISRSHTVASKTVIPDGRDSENCLEVHPYFRSKQATASCRLARETLPCVMANLLSHNIMTRIGPWCSGSTNDSDSFCLGSNPRGPTIDF